MVAKSFFDVDSFNHLCSESNKDRPCGICAGDCTEEDVYKKLKSFTMDLNGVEDINETVNMIPEYAMMLFYLTIFDSDERIDFVCGVSNEVLNGVFKQGYQWEELIIYCTRNGSNEKEHLTSISLKGCKDEDVMFNRLHTLIKDHLPKGIEHNNADPNYSYFMVSANDLDNEYTLDIYRVRKNSVTARKVHMFDYRNAFPFFDFQLTEKGTYWMSWGSVCDLFSSYRNGRIMDELHDQNLIQQRERTEVTEDDSVMLVFAEPSSIVSPDTNSSPYKNLVSLSDEPSISKLINDAPFDYNCKTKLDILSSAI